MDSRSIRDGLISCALRSPDLSFLDSPVEDISEQILARQSESRITQEIQSITRRTLHVVFLEIRKRLVFCISLEGNTFQQYLKNRLYKNKFSASIYHLKKYS